MEVIYKTDNGRLVHGDNIEAMKKIKENSVDSCISDFPYAIEFMGKNWDSSKHWNQGKGKHGTFEGTGYTGKKRPAFYLNSNEDKMLFYNWCYERATELHRIVKPGGYVCIFGHPKTNHRMKSAFEDAGFQIVEEIDWVYGTGFPKNQDIGKLFDKKAGVEREVVGTYKTPSGRDYTLEESGKNGYNNTELSMGRNKGEERRLITTPSSDLAKKWDGWKTAGLKPAHEPITVFQKPMEKNYCYNIEKYNSGAMNIDACRIPTSQEDKNMMDAKDSKNPTTNYSDKDDKIYGKYAEDKASPANEIGRFPANVIFDTYMSEVLDNQSGILKSGAIKKGQPAGTDWKSGDISHERNGGRKVQSKNIPSSEGGASRFFLNIEIEDFVPFLYCPKPSKKEKGEGNSHVTVKPKALIKWLIKLVTPIDGKTIDITAGSGTHGLACEELNKEEGYNLKWIDIELLNTEKEPYCEIAMNRIKSVI